MELNAGVTKELGFEVKKIYSETAASESLRNECLTLRQ